MKHGKKHSKKHNKVMSTKLKSMVGNCIDAICEEVCRKMSSEKDKFSVFGCSVKVYLDTAKDNDAIVLAGTCSGDTENVLVTIRSAEDMSETHLKIVAQEFSHD